MKQPFTSSVLAPEKLIQPALWFVFMDDDILLVENADNHKIPHLFAITDFNFQITQQDYLGMYQDVHCFAVQVKTTPLTTMPRNIVFKPVREAHDLLADYGLFEVVIRTKQILHWDKNTQFCGACGNKNQLHLQEKAKQCPICNTVSFPQISPVMLVLIWRGDEILLGRSAHFLPGVYSLLAGFTEPGETLENTVEREVFEEVGLTVKNIQYFGSQPWPFPSNLMLGFIAEYDSGELQIDKHELEDAKWFSIHDLPQLPRPLSLSRKIIDAYLAKRS